MRAAGLLAIVAAVATAQVPAPELRGVIVERGSDTPLAGVEVSLSGFGPNAENVISQLVLAKAITGPDGAFSFKSVPLGCSPSRPGKTATRAQAVLDSK